MIEFDFHLLHLDRDIFLSDRTLGQIFCKPICENQERIAYTLEDPVRADGVKIFGETAIPDNTMDTLYNVETRISPKFGKCAVIYTDKIEHSWGTEYILEHNGVKYTYILIHGGNHPKDTYGCLCAASSRDTKAGTIWGSQKEEIATLVDQLLLTAPVKLLVTNSPK